MPQLHPGCGASCGRVVLYLPDRHSGGINTNLAGIYGTGSSVVTIDTHLAVGHIEVRNP